MKSELEAITKLFESVKPFTPMNRKITENWLWDSYKFTKVKVKITKNDKVSAHEARVADVFNNLSTLDSQLACDEIYENDYTALTDDMNKISHQSITLLTIV